jgi:hypothetical protein
MRIIRSALFALSLLAFMVAAVVANVSVWATLTLFDEGRFTDTVGEALEDPVVVEGVSQRIAVEVTDAIEAHSDTLPTSVAVALRLVAGSPRDAVEQGIAEVVTRVMTSETLAPARDAAIGRLHETILGLPESEGALQLEGESLVFDITPLIDQVATGLGLDTLADFEMPSEIGQVTLIESSRLPLVLDALDQLRRWSLALWVATIALAILTLLLARNRVHALAWLGLGLVISGGLGALLALTVPNLQPSVVTQPTGVELYQGITAAVTQGLLVQSVLLAFLGGLLMLIGLIVGRRGEPTTARQEAAPGWS